MKDKGLSQKSKYSGCHDVCEVPHWPSYHLPWAALQTHCPCSLGWLAASGVSSSFSWKSISDRTHALAAATQERKTRKFGNVPWLTPLLNPPCVVLPFYPLFYAWLMSPSNRFWCGQVHSGPLCWCILTTFCFNSWVDESLLLSISRCC